MSSILGCHGHPLANLSCYTTFLRLSHNHTTSEVLGNGEGLNSDVAGAVAAVIYNNAANATAAPPGMADDGVNGAFVTIPVVSLSRTTGLAILGQVAAGVSMSISVDPTVRAGADDHGHAQVYKPFPIVGGSSISHYDTVALRNLLMEPAINPDLTHNVKAPHDLTFEFLRDIGWRFPDADADGVVDDEDCNANSNRAPTIVIEGIDSGVENHLFANGCTSSDLIAALAATSTNHGRFVPGIAHLTNEWKAEGIISGREKGAIQSAAARSN